MPTGAAPGVVGNVTERCLKTLTAVAVNDELIARVVAPGASHAVLLLSAPAVPALPIPGLGGVWIGFRHAVVRRPASPQPNGRLAARLPLPPRPRLTHAALRSLILRSGALELSNAVVLTLDRASAARRVRTSGRSPQG